MLTKTRCLNANKNGPRIKEEANISGRFPKGPST